MTRSVRQSVGWLVSVCHNFFRAESYTSMLLSPIREHLFYMNISEFVRKRMMIVINLASLNARIKLELFWKSRYFKDELLLCERG